MVRTSEEVIYGAFPTVENIGVDADAVDAAADLRADLTAGEVPADNRVLIVGSDVTTKLLKNDHLINVNQSGSNDTLRNARIGRLFGMDVYESVVVGADEMFAMHRDAVTFVSITPQLPRGASNAAVQTFDSQAFRVVFDYDVAKKQDTVSGDAYLTAKEIRPEAISGVAFAAAG